MAAGLPASVRSALPSRPWIGRGQLMPRAARCSIRPRKNGRSLRVDALLVERQDVLAARRGQQVVGVLDPFGDALEGVGLADVVVGEEGFELRVADFRVDRHQATSCARQLEDHAFLGRAHFLDRDVVALAAGRDQLVDQQLGRRGAGGDAEPRGRRQPVPVDVGGALHQARLRGSRSLAATSTRRIELEELGAPITTSASQRAAIALTAAWRLVVA